MYSYNTKVLHFKEDIGYVVWLIASLTKSVLNCLEEYKDKAFQEEIIHYMQKLLDKITKNSENALNILEKMLGGANND